MKIAGCMMFGLLHGCLCGLVIHALATQPSYEIKRRAGNSVLANAGRLLGDSHTLQHHLMCAGREHIFVTHRVGTRDRKLVQGWRLEFHAFKAKRGRDRRHQGEAELNRKSIRKRLATLHRHGSMAISRVRPAACFLSDIPGSYH